MDGPNYLSPLRPNEVGAKIAELFAGAESGNAIAFRKPDGASIFLERLTLSERFKLSVLAANSTHPARFTVEESGVITPDEGGASPNPYLLLKNLDVKEREQKVPGAYSFIGDAFMRFATEALYDQQAAAILRRTHPDLMKDLASQVQWGHLDEKYITEYAVHPLLARALLEVSSSSTEPLIFEDLAIADRVHRQMQAETLHLIKNLDNHDIELLHRDFPKVNLDLLRYAVAHSPAEKIFGAIMTPHLFEDLGAEMIAAGYIPVLPNPKR